jgi:hypothetical protein
MNNLIFSTSATDRKNAENGLALLQNAKNSSSYLERGAAIEEVFHSLGIRDYETDFVSDKKGNLCFSSSAYAKLKETHLSQSFTKDLQKNNVNLSTAGEGFLATTSILTGIIEQVTPEIRSDVQKRFFPEAFYPAYSILLDSFDRMRGMTHRLAQDTSPPNVQPLAVTTGQVVPASYGEHIAFEQTDMSQLRRPGDQNYSLLGLPVHIAKNSEYLVRRKETVRISDVYGAIFSNQYVWGRGAIDYGIPTGNQIVASTFFSSAGGGWGTINPDGIIPSSANIIIQLSNMRNIVLKKYVGMKVSAIMNPNTHSLIAQNDNYISRNQYMFANNALNQTELMSGQTLVDYFMGADLNMEILVDTSVYTADANDPNGYDYDTDNYLLPDYQILFYVHIPERMGSAIAEYAYGLTVQNGGYTSPKAGPAFMLIDSMQSNTLMGFFQPTINLAYKYDAIPRILRPLDVWTLDVSS